jgi:hypothetical protein
MKLEDLLRETFDYVTADDFDPKLIFVLSKFIGSVIEINSKRLTEGQKLISLAESWNALKDDEKELVNQEFSPKALVLLALLCFIFTAITAAQARASTLTAIEMEKLEGSPKNEPSDGEHIGEEPPKDDEADEAGGSEGHDLSSVH